MDADIALFMQNVPDPNAADYFFPSVQGDTQSTNKENCLRGGLPWRGWVQCSGPSPRRLLSN
jgi:hypothetical protein